MLDVVLTPVSLAFISVILWFVILGDGFKYPNVWVMAILTWIIFNMFVMSVGFVLHYLGNPAVLHVDLARYGIAFLLFVVVFQAFVGYIRNDKKMKN